MLLSKVRSGIDGFDELVLGGLPRGQSVLVTGGTGTGKSTFAMQFIYKGAKVYTKPTRATVPLFGVCASQGRIHPGKERLDVCATRLSDSSRLKSPRFGRCSNGRFLTRDFAGADRTSNRTPSACG